MPMHEGSIASCRNVLRPVASLDQKLPFPSGKMFGRPSLQEEMRRVCAVAEWTRPEQQILRKSAHLTFDDVLEFNVADTLEACEHQDLLAPQKGRRRSTLRQIVLDRLRSAGRGGSKAATIRSQAGSTSSSGRRHHREYSFWMAVTGCQCRRDFPQKWRPKIPQSDGSPRSAV
jgi:hypothetical protein